MCVDQFSTKKIKKQTYFKFDTVQMQDIKDKQQADW